MIPFYSGLDFSPLSQVFAILIMMCLRICYCFIKQKDSLPLLRFFLCPPVNPLTDSIYRYIVYCLEVVPQATDGLFVLLYYFISLCSAWDSFLNNMLGFLFFFSPTFDCLSSATVILDTGVFDLKISVLFLYFMYLSNF